MRSCAADLTGGGTCLVRSGGGGAPITSRPPTRRALQSARVPYSIPCPGSRSARRSPTSSGSVAPTSRRWSRTRASFVRAACLLGTRGARADRASRRLERSRLLPGGHLPWPIGGADRLCRPCYPAQRGDAEHHRRRRVAWSSLSLFSALESAFNIIYGRPNRSFLRGKALAVVYMGASLLVLFAGLIAGTVGYNLLRPTSPPCLAIAGSRSP